MTRPLTEDSGVRESLDLLSAWLEGQMAHAGSPAVPPGLSIGVVHDQTLVWAGGFGFADLERRVAPTPDTLYRIASITKLFTTTAILQLRDAGRLQLDDPLTKHVSWFAIKSDHGDTPPITVRHLITHTSGLPREAAGPYWTDGSFPTPELVRSGLSQQYQPLPAETHWKYSNLALTLAGEVVTAVSGESWADCVRRHVLEPLGMTQTLVLSPPPDHPGLAVGYARVLPGRARERAPWSDMRGISASSSMTSSVTDLAKFAMLQFRDGPAGGAQILRGTTLREMQRIHWLAPDWKTGWGLGFHIQRMKDKTYVGHGGALRGYRTELRICPADKVAVIALTNGDDGVPATFIEKAFDWVAPALVRAAAPATRRTADAAWQRYVGRYRNPWGDLHVLVHDGRLTMVYPQLADPMEVVSRLVPAGAHAFRVETTNGYGILGELVVFELDAAGTVTRVRLGENYAERVEAW